VEDCTDRIQYAYTGQHLIAPLDANRYAEVRAIADGKVIYIDKPNAAPSADKAHAQNYATFGSGPEWTDKGIVIIEHTTEIGAAGNTPTAITFYSVYAHLKEIAIGVAPGKAIYLKDIIGKPGQIYGEAGHLHFEICFDDAIIKLLLGKNPTDGLQLTLRQRQMDELMPYLAALTFTCQPVHRHKPLHPPLTCKVLRRKPLLRHSGCKLNTRAMQSLSATRSKATRLQNVAMLPCPPLKFNASGVCSVRRYSNKRLMPSAPSSFKGTSAGWPAI
jgi:hypothetical protein